MTSAKYSPAVPTDAPNVPTVTPPEPASGFWQSASSFVSEAYQQWKINRSETLAKSFAADGQEAAIEAKYAPLKAGHETAQSTLNVGENVASFLMPSPAGKAKAAVKGVEEGAGWVRSAWNNTMDAMRPLFPQDEYALAGNAGGAVKQAAKDAGKGNVYEMVTNGIEKAGEVVVEAAKSTNGYIREQISDSADALAGYSASKGGVFKSKFMNAIKAFPYLLAAGLVAEFGPDIIQKWETYASNVAATNADNCAKQLNSVYQTQIVTFKLCTEARITALNNKPCLEPEEPDYKKECIGVDKQSSLETSDKSALAVNASVRRSDRPLASITADTANQHNDKTEQKGHIPRPNIANNAPMVQ